eukprot:SAG31_NODE_16206_length_718_cov_2.022617_1_plen_61_part_10
MTVVFCIACINVNAGASLYIEVRYWLIIQLCTQKQTTIPYLNTKYFRIIIIIFYNIYCQPP